MIPHLSLPSSSSDLSYELREMSDSLTNILAKNSTIKIANKSELQSMEIRLKTLADNMGLIVSLPTAINSEEVLEVIRDEISKVRTQPPISFATAVKRDQHHQHAYKPSVIIEHKDSSKGHAEVMDEIKKTLSFKAKGYAPNKVSRVSNNKIRIELDDETQQSSVIDDLKKSTSIRAEAGKKKQPLVILEGISKDIKPEDLIVLLDAQNPTILHVNRECTDLKLKFIKKHRKHEQLYNAVFEASPLVRNAMIALGRVGLEFSKINCRDFSPFVQCYKCLQFGHTTKHCSASVSPCSICAATDHQFDNCKHKNDESKLKCYNCCKHNDKSTTKRKLETNHGATAVKKCQLIKNMIEIINERVSYV